MNIFILKNKENPVTYSIHKTITSSDGRIFNVGDIVRVVYKTMYSAEKAEIIGRLSQISLRTLCGESIVVDGSGEFNSNTAHIDMDLIISIKRINE